MKQNKHKIWGFLLSLLSLCALLLVINLLSQSPQPAHAHTAQQTNNPPLEILVNNVCSKYNDSSTTNNPTPQAGQDERFRFGDENSHYFKFWGKSGNVYKITTNLFNGPSVNPVIGVDTVLYVYRDNPLEHPGQTPLEQNDDKIILVTPIPDAANDPYESEITFLAEEDRYYYIEVRNLVENGNGTYCLGIEFRPDLTDATHLPDKCEPNNSFELACEVQIEPFDGKAYTAQTFNFKPPEETSADYDYYKIWVKPGERYTCTTTVIQLGNDTKMTLFDEHENVLGVNDDKPLEPYVSDVDEGTRSSKVISNIGYTGWLYILVEPVVDEVDFELGHRYTYKFECEGEIFGHPIDSHQDRKSVV